MYSFDRNAQPRHFTDRLGAHPEFPFLQQENGINTVAAFLQSVRSDSTRSKYAREFKAFDLLLRNSGFPRGYKNLSAKNVENVFVNPGTIGNLGFYDKQRDLIGYSYVRLNPAGEDASGIAAWKLTNAGGCFLYILHTCGNAFYPNTEECCKSLTVGVASDTLRLRVDSSGIPVHVKVDIYEGRLAPSHQKGKKYDTIVTNSRHIDTTALEKAQGERKFKIYSSAHTEKIMICRDSAIKLVPGWNVDSTVSTDKLDSLLFTVTETILDREGGPLDCNKKWEVSLDGGLSFNSIPRPNSATVHTQTNGGHPAAELAVSRIFSHWFQAGISAMYLTLSYQDDILYPGTVAGTYNTIWLGKPIIPVQLFAKATIGGPLGWQSNVSLSAGYSFPQKDRIENGGNTLTTKTGVKGGPTAGFKLGLAYFFSCKFGLGLSFDGQYFSNKATAQNYSLFALPITAGIRYRW